MIETIPLPTIDAPDDRSFWEACQNGRLAIQRCESCGHCQHPPRAMCPNCRTTGFGWAPSQGLGTIWSYTVPRPPLLPAFQAFAPYVVVVVTLIDFPGIRIVGALTGPDGAAIGGIDPEAVRIGAPVRLTFVRLALDVNLPCWSLLQEAIQFQKDETL